jgi:hypothetical protein
VRPPRYRTFETTLLVLLNYPTLVATNAMHVRLAADATAPEFGSHTRRKVLIEFGLRRAQGPRRRHLCIQYAFVGGFDGTSNVAAARLTGIGVAVPTRTLCHVLFRASGLKCRTLVPGLVAQWAGSPFQCSWTRELYLQSGSRERGSGVHVCAMLSSVAHAG